MLAYCFNVPLVAHFEHQIEAKTQEKDICHPTSHKRGQNSTATERDRDRVCCPEAEADGKSLPDTHGHTAPSSAASTQTQRHTNQDHDHGDERKRDSAVVVCLEPCGLRAVLLAASGVGSDVMERHQLGITGEPRGEVVGNEGHRDGLIV